MQLSREPFVKGDGFDLYVDLGCGMPFPCTVSKVVVRVIGIPAGQVCRVGIPRLPITMFRAVEINANIRCGGRKCLACCGDADLHALYPHARVELNGLRKCCVVEHKDQIIVRCMRIPYDARLADKRENASFVLTSF